jgi:hypothetical protein
MQTNKDVLIILNSRELVKEFCNKTANVFGRDDVVEIITQIIFILLDGEENCFNDLSRLPELNRMRNTSYISDPILFSLVKNATHILAMGIYNAVRNLGAYEKNRIGQLEFPYTYDCMLGNDIVLKKFFN